MGHIAHDGFMPSGHVLVAVGRPMDCIHISIGIAVVAPGQGTIGTVNVPSTSVQPAGNVGGVSGNRSVPRIPVFEHDTNASVKFAPVRFVPVRFAPVRFAPVRFASSKVVPSDRFAFVRFAPLRSTAKRFVLPLDRFAPVRFAPLRFPLGSPVSKRSSFTPYRFAPVRFAPLRLARFMF